MKSNLTTQIRQLEQKARKLDVSPVQRRAWLHQLTQHTEAFLEGLSEAPTAVFHPDKARPIAESPIREEGEDFDSILTLIRENLEQKGLKPASGGYLAYVPGGGIYPSALGDFLAAVGNHYAGIFYGSPAGVRMENMLIRWVAELLGFDPKKASGNLASGASIATLTAIHTAREARQLKARDVEHAVVYLSSQTHHTAIKALKIAGLGEALIREVPLDGQMRMKTDVLDQMIKDDLDQGRIPFMIIASLGSTDVGAVDPMSKLAEIAEKYSVWFHIDAAYGGFFALVDECESLFDGVEKADSVVIDPHKGLFISLGLGMLIVKEGIMLRNAFKSSAAYLQDIVEDPSEWSPAELSPELTKHFRGLRMWLSLKLLGVAPFRAALEEKLLLARYFYNQLQQMPGFETPLEPQLSVVLFRYLPEEGDSNEFNQKLIEYIQQDGQLFLSSTNIDGTFYLRLAVLNFRSHLHHLEKCIDLLKGFVVRKLNSK